MTNLKHAFLAYSPFDKLFKDLVEGMGETVLNRTNLHSFPRYEVVSTGDFTYDVSIALAGYPKENLSVKEVPNLENHLIKTFVIEGKGVEKQDKVISISSLTKADFKLQLRTRSYDVIERTEYVNGILTLHVKINLPESLSEKSIEIN